MLLHLMVGLVHVQVFASGRQLKVPNLNGSVKCSLVAARPIDQQQDLTVQDFQQAVYLKSGPKLLYSDRLPKLDVN